MAAVNATNALIIQKDKKVNDNVFLPVMIVGAFSIYVMILPTILMDFFLFQYQFIYFGIMGIPKIRRDDYVVMDRHTLKGLNTMQKVNCVYCEYVNGMVAYAKAVANQTEIYSCAIKHNISAEGQEHQKDFYEYEQFINPVNGDEKLNFKTK